MKAISRIEWLTKNRNLNSVLHQRLPNLPYCLGTFDYIISQIGPIAKLPLRKSVAYKLYTGEKHGDMSSA